MKDRIYQFTYHPTTLNRKPENALEKKNLPKHGTYRYNYRKYM